MGLSSTRAMEIGGILEWEWQNNQIIKFLFLVPDAMTAFGYLNQFFGQSVMIRRCEDFSEGEEKRDWGVSKTRDRVKLRV